MFAFVTTAAGAMAGWLAIRFMDDLLGLEATVSDLAESVRAVFPWLDLREEEATIRL